MKTREGAPNCCGAPFQQHKRQPMRLVALTDEGGLVWRCPRCLLICRDGLAPEHVTSEEDRS